MEAGLKNNHQQINCKVIQSHDTTEIEVEQCNLEDNHLQKRHGALSSASDHRHNPDITRGKYARSAISLSAAARSLNKEIISGEALAAAVTCWKS